jgi:hypothetical protein
MLIMYLVLLEGRPQAAYPRKKQAEVYASGFSKPCEVVKVSVEGYDCLLTMLAPDKGQADVVKDESGSAPCG